VSHIKGIQIVLKEVVEANNLKIDSHLGKLYNKKIIDWTRKKTRLVKTVMTFLSLLTKNPVVSITSLRLAGKIRRGSSKLQNLVWERVKK